MLRDLRYASRMLVKTPGFTAIAVLAVALGIGGSTTMFSAINALLLRPMPYIQDQDRLVAISEFFTKNPEHNSGTAFPDYLGWKKNVTTLEGIAAITEATFIITGGDKPERYLGGQISAEAFSFMGVQPILGRLFRPDEDGLNAASGNEHRRQRARHVIPGRERAEFQDAHFARDGRGLVRSPDRVRECRESSPGSRRDAGEGNRDPSRARREPSSDHSAIARGKH